MDDFVISTARPPIDERPAPLPRRPTATAPHVAVTAPVMPDYMQKTYYWAYVNPRNVRLLDREIVVRTILWQQHRKLQDLAFAEIRPGDRVLQPASVYGTFAPNLAERIGPAGRLDVVDVAGVQVRSVGRKLQPYSWARVHHANIVDFPDRPFDVVCCYFLLHEVPDDYKHRIVNHLLGKVEPGGKVVFVDYGKPRWWHPLKLITSIVFDTLEPYAKTLWRQPIRAFAAEPERFEWSRQTIFAGLFQKVVATRRG